MHTKHHWALARTLLKKTNCTWPRLQQAAYLLGNILPDINLTSYLHGHTYSGSYARQKRQLLRLAAKPRFSLLDAFRTGIFSHYIADYFTLPHSERYSFSLREHCRYERELNPHFADQLAALSAQPVPAAGEDLPGYLAGLESQRQGYLSTTATYQADCEQIIAATSRLLAAAEAAALAKTKAPAQLPAPTMAKLPALRQPGYSMT